MSPWLFNVYIDKVMELKMEMGKRGVRFQEEEESGDCMMYADDLVLCGESEKDLGAIVRRFLETMGAFQIHSCKTRIT